jgi:DNA-binding HxlR family transcriptional regulator
MRAGAQVLLMATDPINRGILRTVLERPLAMDGGLYKVSAGGREVLFVAFIAERWLQSSPRGPIDFDGNEAVTTIAALAEGWSATVMHVLARRPLRFDELRRTVDGVGTRALRRHLAAMQRAGQVEAHGTGKSTTYSVTDWLRAGLAPLAAAARIERRQPIRGAAPIDALDVEAAFHLSLPMLELPKELSGTCRLGVNLEDGEGSTLTGVTARIEEGRIVSCVAGLDEPADAWAAGTADAWLDTVIEPDAKRVRTGGDRWLASALLAHLHRTLFGIPVIRGDR